MPAPRPQPQPVTGELRLRVATRGRAAATGQASEWTVDQWIKKAVLLSFRLAPILFSLFAAAGVFWFIEGARAIHRAINEPPRFRWAVLAIGVIGALSFSQNIPQHLEPEINTADTDTDEGLHAARAGGEHGQWCEEPNFANAI